MTASRSGREPETMEFPGVVEPYDEGSERVVIASILLDPDAITRVMDFLRPEDFYREYLKLIYRAAMELSRRGDPVDQHLVAAELERIGMLDRAGDRAGLANLQSSWPTAANIEHYARIVKDKSRERALLAACRHGTNLVQGPSDLTTDEKIAAAGQAMLGVAMDSPQRAHMTIEIAPRYMEVLTKRVENGGALAGLSSGLIDLDRLTGGWKPGNLIVIAGRPGMGKSALATKCALHTAMQDRKPVAFFSLELSEDELFERMIATIGRVNSQRLGRGDLGDAELGRAYEAIGPVSDAGIAIDDRAAMDEWVVGAEARRLAQKLGGLGLVVIDYVQLMTGRAKTDNKAQEIGNITRALKVLAKQLSCPVVALSQLNRAVEGRSDKRPGLADLRESGAIEQDADIVVMCFRDEYYTGDKSDKIGQCELIVAKNRNGPVGSVDVRFEKEYMAFDNLETRRPGGLS